MSKVMSSLALRDRVKAIRPDLVPLLEKNDWFHSFQNAQDPVQPGFYRCPIMGYSETGQFACRTNRKNLIAAQTDFDEVPRLSKAQTEVVDLFDTIMPTDEYCYSMELERGDMQLLNSFVTLHSRTPFKDFDVADQKRHLMRLWMSIPSSQGLPEDWAEYWGDVRPGAVRGGYRGKAITPDFLKYEQRQSDAMGMKFEPWKPLVLEEDMKQVLQAY